ncbi:Eco57I restriction-modification methylase domain-containing protein [Pseudomonas sp. AS2.8]|uniref:Eco57I restriction-modification methylase domain-containing protein n=1 Tax=Pseudomonas sp. AS2.8 TaxID=2587128 RepID=UPI001613C992|nr:TaqI-like C-terminal specificity domain-containing protein [Pseudomonas sp. AS2.8]MBB2896691.1 hypothetical protein [Pseudomonas sp. AS2.8]
MQDLIEEEAALALEVMNWEASSSEKGQVYTRPEVVRYMLTCLGFNVVSDLKDLTILEPSCGEGEFTTEIIRRLISLPSQRPSLADLKDRLFAIDLVSASVDIAKRKASHVLQDYGYTLSEISTLLENWFHVGDFLLSNFSKSFRYIVGNPPYVRVENIPRRLLAEYRKRFLTMTDRADLYIAFYERALSLLEPEGSLSFICTDRWTKNTYGRSLRALISDCYSLKLYVDLYEVDAFESSVMTYPAITQISRSSESETILVHSTKFDQRESMEIWNAVSGLETSLVTRKGVVNSYQPWLLGGADEIELVRRIEHGFPSLEAAGCNVYIGAATGANSVYIVNRDDVDIEDSRLLPLITASEIKNGKIDWRKRYLINTYSEHGLVSLSDYPKMAKYLNAHKDKLSARHVAKMDRRNWYKTIDRVYEERFRRPKLLIPDISSDPVVVYDSGRFYPNNSIYYLCSEEWDLHALKVIMLSSIARLFINTYSTKIANGYLRFQAQHLRKIRIPRWSDIDMADRIELISAGEMDEKEKYDMLAARIYGLDFSQIESVGK